MTAKDSSASRDCAALLVQGRDLVVALSQTIYAASLEPGIWASPGGHLRHVIDYVDCLLRGADAGFVDYTARLRVAEVEACREAGARELDRCIESLEKLANRSDRIPLDVRCDEGEAWVASTLARELRFVASHTIHHYALIRLTLAQYGISTPASFGVSPSTLAHRGRTSSAGNGDGRSWGNRGPGRK
jgi:uncharacterized damage-inducible protein DinB